MLLSLFSSCLSQIFHSFYIVSLYLPLFLVSTLQNQSQDIFLHAKKVPWHKHLREQSSLLCLIFRNRNAVQPSPVHHCGCINKRREINSSVLMLINVANRLKRSARDSKGKWKKTGESTLHRCSHIFWTEAAASPVSPDTCLLSARGHEVLEE